MYGSFLLAIYNPDEETYEVRWHSDTTSPRSVFHIAVLRSV